MKNLIMMLPPDERREIMKALIQDEIKINPDYKKDIEKMFGEGLKKSEIMDDIKRLGGF